MVGELLRQQFWRDPVQPPGYGGVFLLQRGFCRPPAMGPNRRAQERERAAPRADWRCDKIWRTGRAYAEAPGLPPLLWRLGGAGGGSLLANRD
jgi:hypothetical protein